MPAMSDPSSPPARWLVLDDRVLATLEVAGSRRARGRGLLGRDGIEGALLLAPARSVHTVGMRFAIDVAHLDAEHQVLRVTTMMPNRIGLVVWRSKAIIECGAGALARWGVHVGDRLELR